MGKLFRRAVAFLLGMIFGFTVLAGGIVGGAYWAYKNVKPIDAAANQKVEGLGELEDQTVEELLDLFAEAMDNPDEYTLSRLEKEYGLDVKKFLTSVGINAEDSRQVNVDAIRDISIFTLFTDYKAFLDNIRFRALYVFIPKLTGKPLDEVLSPEAQAKLGDYSVSELIEKDSVTGEIGLVSAIKNLKLGSVLPSVFEDTYDENKHEYTYTAKEDSDMKAISLLGNIEVGTVFNITEGSTIIDELMEGGLSDIADMKLSDIVDAVFGKEEKKDDVSLVADAPKLSSLSDRAKAFGNLTVRDLFKKGEDGKYQFSIDKLADNLVVGYLLGFDKGEDGKWYKSGSTSPVKGVLQTVAGVNVGDIIENKNDIKTMLVKVFGDVQLQELVDTFNLASKLPQGLSKLYPITVGEILDGDNIVDNLMKAVAARAGDSTIGELLSKSSDKVLEDGIYSIKIGKLLDDIKNQDNVLDVLSEALGGIKLGDILNAKKDADGEWISDNKVMSVLYDYTLSNVFELVASNGNTTDMIKALTGDFSIGDFFGAAYGYEYDIKNGNWYRPVSGTTDQYEVLATDFGKALNVKLWQVAAAFDKNNPYNIREDIGDLSIGEAYYSFCQASRNYIKDFRQLENGNYAIDNDDARQISEIVFAIDINEYYEHRNDGKYWSDKFDPVTLKSTIGVFAPGSKYDNVFLEATVGITIGEIADILGRDGSVSGRKLLSDLIQKHYKNVEFNGQVVDVIIGDFFEMFVKNWASNCTLEAIGKLNLADSASAMLGQLSKRETFGHITMNELFGGYLPTTLKNSSFVEHTLRINVADVYDVLKKRSLGFLCHNVLERVYEGLSFYDALDIKNINQKLDEYAEVLQSAQLSSFIHAVHSKDWSAVKGELIDALKSLPREAKIKLAAAGAAVAAALYEIDNARLVDLVNQVLGDMTWGEFIIEFKPSCFGFAEVDGKYMLGDVYNALADRFLSQEIRVTVDKTKCSIKKDYIYELTFGNMLASNSKFDKIVDKFNSSKLRTGVLASEGDTVATNVIFLKGDYERLTKKLFNIKLIDVYHNRNNLKSYIRDTFGDIKLGDIGAPMFRRIANKVGFTYSYSIVDDCYQASGSFINVTDDIFNVTLAELNANKNNVKAYIKEYLGKWSIGDLTADVINLASKKYIKNDYNGKATLSADKTTWTAEGDYDEVLNIIYNINARSFLSGLRKGAKSYIASDAVLGKLRIGYLTDKGKNEYDEATNIWYNKRGDAILFSGSNGAVWRRIYMLTIGEVLAPGFELTSVIESIYMGEMLGYTCGHYAELGHEHTDSCVWYKLDKVVVENTNEATTLNVRVKELDQLVARVKLGTVLEEGLSLESIFGDSKLGDIFGFKGVDDVNDPTKKVWYNYEAVEIDGVKYEVVNVDDAAEGYYARIPQATQASPIDQAIGNLDAGKLLTTDATADIINAIKPLKIGETFNYTKVDGEWYKVYSDDGDASNDEKVDRLMSKLCDKTISDMENGLSDIINDWTVSDVLDEQTIASSSILNAVKDAKLAEVSSEIEKVYVGTAMGYEKKADGWYDGAVKVDDDVTNILAEYQIGHLTGTFSLGGKTFSDDIVDKMLNNVKVGTFYPDAGKGDGIVGLLEADWTVGDIPNALTNKIKNGTNVKQLIGIGAFGDFFDKQENYDAMDTLFMTNDAADMNNDGAVTQMEAREYWENLTMPKFMESILNTVARP